MTKTIIIATVVVGIMALLGWRAIARDNYETATYEVVKTDKPFEIRDYPDLTVVSTEMKFGRQGNDGSFMRLFRYISGGNEKEQKIAMTTPVFMEMESAETKGQMAFVLPKDVAEKGAPKSGKKGVAVDTRTGGKFAVYRFAGRMDEAAAVKAEAKLREWMKTNDLQAKGEPEFAGYDAPWTPGPMRRNEVLLRIK